ncbi:hypothetical protein EPO05_05070 [Patescibacteria group bacterium]|nr:MAG: hypothetical protein EPO05_05070 [Patescibacteria group bacterium]
MKKETLVALIVTGSVLFLGAVLLVAIRSGAPRPFVPSVFEPRTNQDISASVTQFKSEQEFKDYLEKTQSRNGMFGGFGMGGVSKMESTTLQAPMAADSAEGLSFRASSQRVSTTNVQVAGIDEPDIVKTDGRELYISREGGYWLGEPIPMGLPAGAEIGISADAKIAPCRGEGCVPPPYREPSVETVIVRAKPAQDLKRDGKIEQNGNLLLSGKMLVIFSDAKRKFFGYDVSDPQNPKEKWSADWKDNSYLVSARLMNGKLYVVSQTNLNYGRPCPFEPLAVDGETMSVRCEDVYHPIAPVPAETTFTVARLNVTDGKVEKATSFLGSGGSVTYMSSQAVYVTYSKPGDFLGFMVKFFQENRGMIPNEVVTRLEKVASYDLSDGAKSTEFSTILERYQSSLSNDERMKMENEMENRMANFAKAHARELEETGIVRIENDNLTVSAAGSVPGSPLNQFSLDEYQGNLRIATTIGGGWFGTFGTRSESTNDLYVLGKDLSISGKIEDLGVGERIYSARFLGDKGYLVTFKQTDPFFVLDLSDPRNPQKKGELKIPGFSSYLHPINDTRILGVGQENGKVKLSLFDVASAENPKEIAKYNLDDYWTEISNNHHAFLLDPDHKIFFLPGGNGGYVFSYTNDELKLQRALSDIVAKRAVYISDALYVIGQDKIRVLNENNWEEIGKLEF